MPVSSRNGWGFNSSQFAASQVVAAANNVVPNVGIAASVIAGGSIRLTKISYRVDLAPDVAAGAAVAPTLWRLFVIVGVLPNDLSAYQQQAFPAGAHPEIPKLIGNASPQPLLYDVWLDFGSGDPGLNQLAEIDFADAGPTVGAGQTLNVVLMPIIDANFLVTAPVGVANAVASLGAYGTGVSVNPQGSAYDGAGNGERSIPRYDVSLNGQ